MLSFPTDVWTAQLSSNGLAKEISSVSGHKSVIEEDGGWKTIFTTGQD